MANFEPGVCPICGREMTPGYIQSRDGLGWSEKKRLVAALSGAFCDVELGNAVIAHNCPACKKMFIDYKDAVV